jgi:type IV secretory pathway VirJ component
VRRLILILVLIFGVGRLAAGFQCTSRVNISDLPLVELPTSKTSDRFAVMISGDGGWRRIDRKVTDELRAAGVPVVGFLAPDYFRTRRTPDESACALERVIRHYQLQWRRQRVILIGYSRGADVLPFMASRLPEDLRPAVRLIALLGLEPMIDFKYHSFWLPHLHREPQFPVKPEVEKLRGQNVVCVYGEKERDSLCQALDPSAFKIVREPGSHHFAGQYRDVADVILREAK